MPGYSIASVVQNVSAMFLDAQASWWRKLIVVRFRTHSLQVDTFKDTDQRCGDTRQVCQRLNMHAMTGYEDTVDEVPILFFSRVHSAYSPLEHIGMKK